MFKSFAALSNITPFTHERGAIMNTNVAVTALVVLTYVATSMFGNLGKKQDINNADMTAQVSTSVNTQSPSNSGKVQLDPVGRNAAVNSDSTNMRTGPGKQYPVIDMVDAGTELLVVSKTGDWHQVKTPSGDFGWIHGSLLLISDEPVDLKEGVNSTTKHVAPSNKYAYEVVGYYTEDYAEDMGSYNVAMKYASSLTALAPFSYSMDRDGNLRGSHSERAESVADKNSLTNLALIHNVIGGNFNKEEVSALLNSKSARSNAVSNIVKLLDANGYDGVNIDFENIPPTDREVLTAFMQELYKTLNPKGYRVTISMPAKNKDAATSAWSGAFDYYEIGKNVDQVMLMTYDEHVPGGAPGPIASYSWVESVIKYASTQIPKKKVLIGIPGYGYDWNVKTNEAKAVTYSKAISNASKYKVEPKFDSASKGMTYSYEVDGAKHEVWFENADTLKAKLNLVRNYGIGGIAIWRLGLEDQNYWTVIKDRLLDS